MKDGGGSCGVLHEVLGVFGQRVAAVGREVLALEIDLEQVERRLALEVASAGPLAVLVEELLLEWQQEEGLLELAADLVLVELGGGSGGLDPQPDDRLTHFLAGLEDRLEDLGGRIV